MSLIKDSFKCKFLDCQMPGVRISIIIFQLCLMALIIALLFLAQYGSFNNSTFQTFVTIYTFICVFLCYIQFTTTISPENSRDLEALVVLVLFQVTKFLPFK